MENINEPSNEAPGLVQQPEHAPGNEAPGLVQQPENEEAPEEISSWEAYLAEEIPELAPQPAEAHTEEFTEWVNPPEGAPEGEWVPQSAMAPPEHMPEWALQPAEAPPEHTPEWVPRLAVAPPEEFPEWVPPLAEAHPENFPEWVPPLAEAPPEHFPEWVPPLVEAFEPVQQPEEAVASEPVQQWYNAAVPSLEPVNVRAFDEVDSSFIVNQMGHFPLVGCDAQMNLSHVVGFYTEKLHNEIFVVIISDRFAACGRFHGDPSQYLLQYSEPNVPTTVDDARKFVGILVGQCITMNSQLGFAPYKAFIVVPTMQGSVSMPIAHEVISVILQDRLGVLPVQIMYEKSDNPSVAGVRKIVVLSSQLTGFGPALLVDGYYFHA
ncbi:hypothetical protein SPI_01457 [Niveomyces insectorum RCEF 264]|uniref:Uncharacterized protein n=1 Tax=Niveomyces insectorum RCEF 264 TaxID=1081102 RepID=A0A167YZE3_9HYPO|nr:hypothetical protein SPI_01457 [Niveomyces insectorum RCEF 264]